MGSANPQLANMQQLLLTFLSALLWSTTFGQTSLNAPNMQDNICYWTEIRAAPVQQTLYIDGGQMYMLAADGIDSANGQQTTMFYMNYTESFQVGDIQVSKNWTSLFKSLPDGPSVKDMFYSGFMFADDFQLLTYGGLVSAYTGSNNTPSPDYIWGDAIYADNSPIDQPVLGPQGTSVTLPSGVTRYLTNGAGVNVPSEKLGFYFGGMTNADTADYDVWIAQTPSATLLQVDMSIEGAPDWSLSTLPHEITSRADAALVWVPVGAKGTLLAIGGVINPEERFGASLNGTQVNESEDISPSFMTSIAVYDIANGAWYVQNISGSEVPGQLTQFCSVMVSEETPSSYQIYIHGGYNGLLGTGASNDAAAPNNDVWVLSVPSFTWTKVSSGQGKGRKGHFCTAPYPDQMLVIGGTARNELPCLDSIIKVFNLNTLTWQAGYDPSTWSHYKIPTTVANAIAAHPTASWSDPNLKTLFDTKYTKNIPTHYPYPNLTPHKSTGVAAIAGGAAAGGVCLLVLVGAILWYRRKQHKKPPRAGDAEVQPYEQVNMWRHGVPKTEPSVTTTEIGDTPDVNPNTGGYYKPAAAEIAGDENFRRHSAASPRPGGFAEAGGGTRRISGVPTMSPRSPRSPRSPNLGTLDAQEVDGEERYEMEDMQGHRGSGDIGARSRFRDHHLYPLSVSDGDGRSQASGPSYSGPSHSHSQASRGDGNRNVPSPYLMAHPGGIIVDDINNNAELPASPVRPNHLQHTRNISSLSSLGNGNGGGHGFPQVSPPLEQQANPMTTPTPPTHTRTTSEDELDALEAFHTGMVPSRPSHKRNASSMSSRLNQLPTPTEELPEAERNRQSTLLAKLPSPTVGSAAASPLFEQERNPLLSAAALAGNGAEQQGRTQSPTGPVGGENGNGNAGRGGIMVGDELYSPSYYSQGSTLVTSARSPISRRPVGQGFEGDVGKGGGKGTF